MKNPEFWDVWPFVIIYPSTPRKVPEDSTLHKDFRELQTVYSGNASCSRNCHSHKQTHARVPYSI